MRNRHYTLQALLAALMLLTLLSASLITPGFNRPRAIQAQEAQDCPPPEAIQAQQALLDARVGELIGIRAYKDATLNELARLNVTYYSLRGALLRALMERARLIAERRDLLDSDLSEADIERLLEIQDLLFEQELLITAGNEESLQQILLMSILWEPVIDLIVGVSVERYYRFTQRILEIREGDTDEALEYYASMLENMQSCEGFAPQFIPPTPSGVGD